MNALRFKLALVSLITFIPLGVVLASPTPPSPTPAQPAVSSDDNSQHLNNLKSHGIAEADRRLAQLQTVATRLASSTQLTAADKGILTKQLDDQVATLGALKSKLAAESDLFATRKIVQLLIDEYNVYGLLVAKVSLSTAADRMAETQTQLQTVVTELQKKADALKKTGHDTTELQKSIDAAKIAITSAQPLFSGTVAKITAFKPTEYSADHKMLTSYRDNLATARDNFRAARLSITDSITSVDKLK